MRTVTIPYVIFTSGLVLTADCAEQLGYASLSRPFPPQVGKGSDLRDYVCAADYLFQSSRPGYLDVIPTTVGGCSTYTSFHSSLTNWRDKATKLYLFSDDIFQPYLVSVLLTIFSSPFHSSQSSPVQSSDC